MCGVLGNTSRPNSCASLHQTLHNPKGISDVLIHAIHIFKCKKPNICTLHSPCMCDLHLANTDKKDLDTNPHVYPRSITLIHSEKFTKWLELY